MAEPLQAGYDVGYQLFLEADGEVGRDDLNDALVAKGYKPISKRMLAHYRALRGAGESNYITINSFDVRRSGESGPIRSVYLTATLGFSLSALVDHFGRSGLEVSTAGDTSPSVDLASSTKDAIAAADALVGVVASNQADAVLFELGIAWGLGKPVVLGVEWHADGVLDGLTWVNRVNFHKGNFDPILHAVERLRERPEGDSAKLVVQESRIDLERYREAFRAVNDIGFEGLVADLLADGGGDVHGRIGERQRDGFDFAVWMPGLEPVVGNPLLVEVKQSLRSPIDALNQIEAYLGGTGRHNALLIYRSGPPSSDLLANAYPVIPIRFDELLDELEGQSLDSVLVRWRNRAVHSLGQ